jgi:predicted nuclease with TOPRIM domain
MVEQATSAQQTPSPEGERGASELREELDRSREEILRLRDLLIGKDVELGALRGRLAELEDRSARLLNMAARLQTLMPKTVWTAAARLRRAQRRRS